MIDPDLFRVFVAVQASVLSVVFLVWPTRDLGPIRYGVSAVLAAITYSAVDLMGRPALLRPFLLWVGVTILTAGVIRMVATDAEDR